MAFIALIQRETKKIEMVNLDHIVRVEVANPAPPVAGDLTVADYFASERYLAIFFDGATEARYYVPVDGTGVQSAGETEEQAILAGFDLTAARQQKRSK
ncbi:hypothetical protein C5E10_13800 [Pseudoclavibacter sp. RFBG4]|uniref:hypothetical protein n=1 Tax=Pseudoclavibacter sp. RFBG4 TaxID=2080575 RepID=UPI000CE8C111|nr:hypothetical protein [Pseudoclavibacter sp. RFBG4]PPG28651.1 hypothetical protein C5E10_13800 [Pseudoclavibacter sp. RFBG4]